MTPDLPATDDPFGYRQDLERVLAYPTPDNPNPVPVVLALGRCIAFGVPVPAALAATADRHIPAAAPALLAELGDWTASARTLGERFDATDDPWEADGLVRALVECRVTAHGLEGVAPAVFGEAVREFDAALRTQAALLGSAAGSPWFENLRLDLPPETVADCWWLNPPPEPAETTLPPPDYFATVRRVRAWKAAEPTTAGVMAATTRPADAFRTFVWRSPDGRHAATMVVHASLSDADRRGVPTPLMFERGPGDPAAELSGTPVRLGSVSGVIDGNGDVAATVQEWWADSDGRLYVGEAGTEWPLQEGRP